MLPGKSPTWTHITKQGFRNRDPGSQGAASETRKERPKEREARRNVVLPASQSCPSWQSSLSPGKASPTPSHSPKLIKEDHSTYIVHIWVSETSKLSIWPRIPFLFPRWKRWRREQGVSSFAPWWWAASPKGRSPDASGAPGKLLAVQVLRSPPHPPMPTETRAGAQQAGGFNELSRWFWCTLKVKPSMYC